MTSEKKLQKIGIIPKEKLKIEEKNHIAKTIASKLSENIEALSDCYHELYMRIFNSDLYYADMDQKFCGIFYFYKTNTIYIDENKNVSNIDGYMIHEVIHYLQNFSKLNQKIRRVGLCYFTDLKIMGLGMNEAMAQYIAARAAGNEIQEIYSNEVTIWTNSEEHYKYMTSLIIQMLVLMGEEKAIKSCIYSTDEFENELYNTFEENTNKILKNFDMILKENNKVSRDENKIIEVYLQTQEMIYKNYFTKKYNRLTEIKEVDDEVQKLNEYEKIIGKINDSQEKEDEFTTFKKKMSTKFMDKYIEVSRKNSRNALVIYKKSFYDIWKKITDFIQKKMKRDQA